jgi:hypothetical protein
MKNEPNLISASLRKVRETAPSVKDHNAAAKERFIEELSKGNTAVFPTEFIKGKETTDIILSARKLIRARKKATC